MQITHYEVGKKLGEGDMGSVYIAKDTRNDRRVALKVLHKIDMKAEMDRGAAAEIIEFAAGIQHPNLHPIIDVIDTNENGGVLGLVMPTAAASVGDFFRQSKTIPPKHGVKILETVAGLLHDLHRQEVAHGSIKPTNVLLDRQGQASVTDLPMAHLRDFGMVPAQATELQQHYIHVDLMYHSTPEYAADLYALAAFGYHLLAGHLPFSDPRPEVRRVERPPLEHLPPDVYAVLMRGMTHRKTLVYPDIPTFMADLKLALQGESIDRQTARWFHIDRSPDDDDLPE